MPIVQNSLAVLARFFFDIPADKPIPMQVTVEFVEFWKTLSPEEKLQYRMTPVKLIW